MVKIHFLKNLIYFKEGNGTPFAKTGTAFIKDVPV